MVHHFAPRSQGARAPIAPTCPSGEEIYALFPSTPGISWGIMAPSGFFFSGEVFIVGFRIMVVTFHTLGFLYVFWRLGALFPAGSRKLLHAGGVLLWSALPLGLSGEKLLPPALALFLTDLGFYIMPVLLHTAMVALLIDLYHVLSWMFPLPEMTPLRRRRLWAWGGLLVALGVTGGYLNARWLRQHDMTVTLPWFAPGPPPPPLRLAVATDLHAGAMVHDGHLRRIVDLIVAASPDAVLLGGDILDGHIGQARKAELAEELRRIPAPLGVFAVPGNHEFYAGIDEARAYLREGHVRVLEDEAVVLGHRLLLVGRIDAQARFFGRQRRPLAEILPPSRGRGGRPVVVLDHAPHFDEAATAGVALQFSGHTHHGQLFPFNLIVRRLFGFSSGWHRQERTLFYVSPGSGTWGPPVRTTARPEVVLCTVRFSSATDVAILEPESRGESAGDSGAWGAPPAVKAP